VGFVADEEVAAELGVADAFGGLRGHVEGCEVEWWEMWCM